MSEIYDLLVRHGTVILFVVVFIDRIGIPLPSAPWLLAAGALAVGGKMNWLTALVAAASGGLLADMIWFYLGRHYGNRVLGLLCRISFEPDSCARRTQNLFTRYGMRGLVVSKFIPGLSTLAPPLAGNSGMSPLRFLFFDGLGSVLHAVMLHTGGRSIQPATGTNHQCARRSWSRRNWCGCGVGCTLHRLQIFPAISFVARIAHGANHRG